MVRAGFTEEVSLKYHLKDKKELVFREKKMCELRSEMLKSIPGKKNSKAKGWTETGTFEELKEGSPCQEQGGGEWKERDGRIQPGTQDEHGLLVGLVGISFLVQL